MDLSLFFSPLIQKCYRCADHSLSDEKLSHVSVLFLIINSKACKFKMRLQGFHNTKNTQGHLLDE